jgi:hypothetical protein
MAPVICPSCGEAFSSFIYATSCPSCGAPVEEDPKHLPAWPVPPSPGDSESRELQEERERWVRRAKTAGLWLGGGGLVTIATFAHAASNPSGGHYFVLYGPMIFGAVRLIESLVKIKGIDRKLSFANPRSVAASSGVGARPVVSSVQSFGKDSCSWAVVTPLPPHARSEPAGNTTEAMRRRSVLMATGLAVGIIALATTIAAELTHRYGLTPSMPSVVGTGQTTPSNSEASAPRGTPLGLPGFAAMAVDEVHQHVFVTAGGQSGDIKVVDFDGHLVQTLTGEPGASGMAIHGTMLYVALSQADQIDRIDTSTLKSIGPLSLPTGSAPNALAWAGGRLWVGVGDCAQPSRSSVVSLKAGSGEERTYPDRFFPDRCPRFATSPTDSNILVAWDPGGPSTVSVYGVVTGRPVLLVRRVMVEANVPRAAVSFDGTELLMTGGSGLRTFSLQTLKPIQPSYRASPAANGVATSNSAHIVVTAGTDGTDLWDFLSGVPYPEESIDAGGPQAAGRWNPESRIYPGAVAVTGMATSLVFEITGDEGNGVGHDAWFNVWHPFPQG